jgi:CheY-like chemotaxis protein
MGKKILVIDDEGIIIKTVGSLLQREGYDTETCQSGLRALELVKSNHFDLIIADIRMPEMDGLETIGNIKKHLKSQKKPDIPVIFITGYADSDAHLKAEKIGEVIFKPFDMKEFLAKVAAILKK